MSVCSPTDFFNFHKYCSKAGTFGGKKQAAPQTTGTLEMQKRTMKSKQIKKVFFCSFFFFNTHTKTNMRRTVELSGAQTGASMHQALQARSSQKGAPRKPIPCQFRSDSVPTEVWKDRMTVSDRTKSMSHFGS